MNTNPKKIQIFQTDRGNELKNRRLDERPETFYIQYSPSMKRCPYDNVLTEATFKIIKPGFIKEH